MAEDDRDFIEYLPPPRPLTKEEIELLGSGMIPRRLMTREELEKEFPNVKIPQR